MCRISFDQGIHLLTQNFLHFSTQQLQLVGFRTLLKFFNFPLLRNLNIYEWLILTKLIFDSLLSFICVYLSRIIYVYIGITSLCL